MASTIKVDNVQNQPGTNIIDKCGTTITLGASGDTVALASGASQTGFGRTGTVDWETTKKTTGFTAVSGKGYFCDTGGGAFQATLPASPSAGAIVAFSDYDGNFGTAALTVGRNSSNIQGAASDFLLEKNNITAQFIYVDATEGWRLVLTGSESSLAKQYIVASGGTESTSGDFKIHKFTGPGTFTVCTAADAAADNVVSYMVVAGGGGGGRSNGGGGGAGGFREGRAANDSYTVSPLNAPAGITVTATSYPITVGGGGAKATTSPPSNACTDGSNSIFSTITSTGGGGGGHWSNPGPGQAPGRPGGSGGGAGDGSGPTGGTGNSPPVSPAQGKDGGNGAAPGMAGGGGGATEVGVAGGSCAGGPGGIGATTHITASAVVYSGGGGGGAPGPKTCGTGGINPGGPAPAPQADRGGAGNGGPNGQAGLANTGGGSGGATGGSIGCNVNTGGSGVVVIRYKYKS